MKINMERGQDVSTLDITETGTIEYAVIAEWGPSSAKLVLNKQWKRGIHCHDVMQAVRIMKGAL